MPAAGIMEREQPPRVPYRHRQFRAIFVSDLHLGARSSQAEAFIDFLRHHDAGTIYLVGDIVDFWSMKRSPSWQQSHNDVLQKLLRKARKGARIVFIPGNHDEAVRGYCGMTFGAIEIRHNAVHVTADGRRFLVIHGDEFDVSARYSKWFRMLGDRSYEFAQWCDGPLNRVRRWLGRDRWSLLTFLKLNMKSAVRFIDQFERAVAAEAKRRYLDGVICGHVHHLADRTIDGVRYLNCGDWMESCTAIAEDNEGQLHLIRWRHAPSDGAARDTRAVPLPLAAMGTIVRSPASSAIAAVSQFEGKSLR
jgi:UDP-2,3-diacylglucosamine pyrophosphatase LpxH